MTSLSARLQTLFSLYPLVPVALCFVCGIVFGEQYGLQVGWVAVLCLSGVLLLMALLIIRRPFASTLLLLALTFMVGILSVIIANRNLSAPQLPYRSVVEAVVVDEPVPARGANLRADVVILSGPLTGKGVRVYFFRNDDEEHNGRKLTVGDGVVFKATLDKPFQRGSSFFDYTSYLKSRGIVATAKVWSNCWRTAALDLTPLSLLARARISALRLRHRIEAHYAHLGLSGQALAIPSAMVLGNKADVSADVRNAYSTSGASHVLALSGLHLSIIYSLLTLLSLGRKGRAVYELLAVVAMWCYVFMVGLSPSVVRAAVMVTVYSIVGLTGRRGASLNVLAFAALVMLVANPLSLFDIGFQLSFAAMTFILGFHGALSSLVPLPYQQSHPFVRFVWQLLLLSTIATLGTLPLIAAYFGRLPAYFLVANLLVVPAATLIIYAFLALPLLSLIPVVGSWAVTALSCVVEWIGAALRFISSWPCASENVPSLSPLQVVLLYVAVVSLLVALSMYSRYRQYNWL